MNFLLLPLLVAFTPVALAASPAASVVNPAAIVQKNACMSCHAVDRKVVGPAFKDVAKKYKNTPEADKLLIGRVKGGGKNVWSPVPMPPNPQVKEEDLKVIVKWVLEQ